MGKNSAALGEIAIPHLRPIVSTDAKRLKALEAENTRLKRIVAECDLELEVMKEIAAKKW